MISGSGEILWDFWFLCWEIPKHGLKLIALPKDLKTLLLAMMDGEPARRPGVNLLRERLRKIHTMPEPSFAEVLGETVRDVAPYAAGFLLLQFLFGRGK